MASYELTYIVRTDVDENGLNAVMDRVASIIANGGGQVLFRKLLGKRRLAYPIRKLTEGTYVYLALDLPPTSIRSIERNLTLTDSILRSIVVRVEPEELLTPEPPAPAPQPAQTEEPPRTGAKDVDRTDG